MNCERFVGFHRFVGFVKTQVHYRRSYKEREVALHTMQQVYDFRSQYGFCGWHDVAILFSTKCGRR